MFWMSAIMYTQVVGSTQLHFGKSRLHHFQITKRYKLRFTSVVHGSDKYSDNSDRMGFFRYYLIRSVIRITKPILKWTSFH